MKAYVFPGQGAQFPGMGKDLFETNAKAKELFQLADKILGFEISSIMFDGSAEELKETKVTQPAIFLHSVILAKCLDKEFSPNMVAGHSLGEISALVANRCLNFKDGLSLVNKRAQAMQKACEKNPSTMAAILGIEDKIVEDICNEIDGTVVAANYNCPGQLVISGDTHAIDIACDRLSKAGAKRALKLPVGGAFHSPLMEPARAELQEAISNTEFKTPICPIYQNVNANSVTSPETIKTNLIAQLTAPVRWTQTMQNMLQAGDIEVIEVGPGRVLQGLFKKVDRTVQTSSASLP